jgi:hypothetical protein
MIKTFSGVYEQLNETPTKQFDLEFGYIELIQHIL